MNARDGEAAPGSVSFRKEGEGVAVSLGSNLGDRPGNLASALRVLEERWGLRSRSDVYESPPARDGRGRALSPEGRFLNLCVVLDRAPAPMALLERLHEMEAAAGRPRSGGDRGGDRKLDLDLLLYGERRIRSPDLTVPHPRMTERAFVLVPLAEIAGSWAVPGAGATVAELTAGIERDEVVRWGTAGELVERSEEESLSAGVSS